MRPCLFVIALLFAACSSAPPECAAIAQRCQPRITAGIATASEKDCYDNASHVWTASQCVDNLARCQGVCLPLSPDGGG